MTYLGIDIGTGSSKGVLVDARGAIVAQHSGPHHTSRPRPGWFEHDADEVWWRDLVGTVAALGAQADLHDVDAMCLSGIGPVTLPADADGRPLRPAILYGIDTRAEREITALDAELGAEKILRASGNRLTSQAVAPKMRWVATHEPQVWSATRRWYSASSYLVGRLTGEYVMDRYTASTSDPMYDQVTASWWEPAWLAVAPHVERPRLLWPGDVAGTLGEPLAVQLGLPAGVPVLAGTVDAYAEAYSVGAVGVGDLMVMYGSTLFLIGTLDSPVTTTEFWSATGRDERSFCLSAGMATSGLVATWFADVVGTDIAVLHSAAHDVAPGSEGLVLLPYFAGERTPLFDPSARGCWLGLTLAHTPAAMYRSCLEGTAYGTRHNIERMAQTGADPRRLVAVGGGARDDLWIQIVSDVSGRAQDVPTHTIGASYGDARMAADALGVDTSGWNPVARRIEPREATRDVYDEGYGIYRRTYEALMGDMHRLARRTAE
jgi:xylulokinase